MPQEQRKAPEQKGRPSLAAKREAAEGAAQELGRLPQLGGVPGLHQEGFPVRMRTASAEDGAHQEK